MSKSELALSVYQRVFQQPDWGHQTDEDACKWDDEWKLSDIVQELCESRGGRPGLSVLTSLLVSVDVKNY